MLQVNLFEDMLQKDNNFLVPASSIYSCQKGSLNKNKLMRWS